VLGACSVSISRGLTTSTYEDAKLKQASILAARTRILVTTGDKLNQSSNFRFGEPADLTHLITTPDAADEALDDFRAQGIDVAVA
jgi:DeoR/GlpR family transcriptional regulator of sugar metabolism